jgi:hypothetical protein
MPDFRKWLIALAGVTLFTGLASAQVANTTCTVNGSATPILRGEGFTEQTGDIILVCTGGTPGALANITLFMNTQVTSRLLGNASISNASEALLLINEPGPAAQSPCNTPGQGAGTGANPTPCPATSNVYQGLVTGNQITFLGIPVLPPGTQTSSVLRITNVRVNASALSASGPTPSSVIASVSTSGTNAVNIVNPTLTVGFVQQGLSPTGTKATTISGGGTPLNVNQCNSLSLGAGTNLITFQENFATAFKTQFASPTNGTAISPTNSTPGVITNSESGFIQTGVFGTGGGTTTNYAGVANFGTRLKATFTNVPSGVSIFVSTRDIINTNTAAPSGNPNAVLVVGENVPSPNGAVPAVTPTQTSGASSSSPQIQIAPVTIIGNSGTAVWEVLNTNPNTIDSLTFGVYMSYTANVANNTPAPGTIGVTLSFAPTPSGGGFTATAGAAASGTLNIPRFSDTLDINASLVKINICQTALLFPYVVNVNGFDTGIAIANTTTDPFGTSPQAGPCQLTFYGSGAPATQPPPTSSIASGMVYTNLASTLAPGFSGYMIAVCNFQDAHGFAFVSDVGARNLAMGYLPLVITDRAAPANQGENLNN